jgi:hypothetical protein
MSRRRHINADPTGRIARAFLAVADAARWPFEWLVWTFERRLLWPLRERAAGWAPGRAAGACALGAVAVAAVLVGVQLSGGHDGVTVERTGARVGVVTGHVGVPDTGVSNGPALRGVPPSFGVGKGVGVSEQSSPKATKPESGSPAEAETGETAEAAGEGATAEGEGAATASSAKPVPAGPAAMKVARRFAEAFVYYEVGERAGRAKAVFGETATSQLAGALAERPPRLPQGSEVPKAKVVNLVPGPRRGKAYTVSASLLRVGVTSELRLSLRHSQADGWQVTDVLG